MDIIISLLTTLNSLSPLAVIALFGLVIFMMVKAKTDTSTVVQKVNDLGTNHLHCMPDILETLQRIEVKLSEEFAYLKARINGGGRPSA